MPRATVDNLAALAETAERERAGTEAFLMACAGTGCVSAGSLSLCESLGQEIDRRGLSKKLRVVATGCNGFCAHGPICVVQPEGVFYERLKPEDAAVLIDRHFEKGERLLEHLYRPAEGAAPIPLERDIPFFARQRSIALRNRGRLDPEDIGDAIRLGTYRALARVLREGRTGDELIKLITRSGLRGRGGGGFPTGVKWASCLAAAEKRSVKPIVVCNGDEGDPGAFMDRSIVEADPHAVLEGMLIGAYALGAEQGFVYIRREYPLAMRRLERALEQAREWGVLGGSVLGTPMRFDVQIHQGAGAFVCGESTALMASMEGRPGEPRAKYVHTVEVGYRGLPTVLNNVETWATVPAIVERGAEWFAAIGTGDVSESPWNGSTGTKLFSLVGAVQNTGLVEVPMGATLREIVFEIGGGVRPGRTFKAVQTGGPSGGCLPESLLDLKVDFDSLVEAGSMMGSGGMIVMDDRSCMVDVARYFVDFLLDESCGKCTPCREGLTSLKEILERITRGEGRPEDLALLEDLGQVLKDGALCGLGQTAANPVLSTLRYFRGEYEAHIRDHRCPGGVCKALVRYSIDAERCTGCRLCVKTCPAECIAGTKKKPHQIDVERCTRCGTCLDACPEDAIRVE